MSMAAPTLLESDRIRREARESRADLLEGRGTAPARSIDTAVRAWVTAVDAVEAAPNDGVAVTEETAVVVGSALAKRIHLEGVRALHTSPSGATAPVSRAEANFVTALAALRQGAVSQSLRDVNVALSYLGGTLMTSITDAAAAVDPDATNVAEGFDAVAVSQLTRRTAALAAAAVPLQRRVTDPGLVASTAGIADRRSTLESARGPDLRDTVTSVAALEPGTRTAFLARVVDSAWVDRPDRPYTRLLTAKGEELRVHFKNTRRIGHGESQWMWSRCKAEGLDDAGVAYAVSEFEGPTTTAGEVWESWLQVEVRGAYDVAPSSVHTFAAFAAPGTTACTLDLAVRTTDEETP
jgi:hypothetical protein